MKEKAYIKEVSSELIKLKLKVMEGFPIAGIPMDLVILYKNKCLAIDLIGFMGKYVQYHFKYFYDEKNRKIKQQCIERDPNEIIYEYDLELAKKLLAEAGYRSELTPTTHNFDEEKLMARWSHKHLGHLAGLGPRYHTGTASECI